MTLNAIPLWTALLPAVGVHASYLIGASLGHLGWCVPYFPDCVSISATGRHPPESIVFQATVVPTAVLTVVYWKLSFDWLKGLGRPAAWRCQAMLVLGVVAGLGLLLYAALLGEVGDLYKLQRRVGMTAFYVLTFLAQALLSAEAGAAAAGGDSGPSARMARALALAAGLVGGLGLLSLLSWAFYDGYRRFEDAFEWTVTLLILAQPLIAWKAWRETGFKARRAASGNRP